MNVDATARAAASELRAAVLRVPLGQSRFHRMLTRRRSLRACMAGLATGIAVIAVVVPRIPVMHRVAPPQLASPAGFVPFKQTEFLDDRGLPTVSGIRPYFDKYHGVRSTPASWEKRGSVVVQFTWEFPSAQDAEDTVSDIHAMATRGGIKLVRLHAGELFVGTDSDYSPMNGLITNGSAAIGRRGRWVVIISAASRVEDPNALASNSLASALG